MNIKLFIKQSFIFLLVLLSGCEWSLPVSTGTIQDITNASDLNSLYPETALKGWQLNTNNTGLCNDYTGLVDIDPSTVGRIEQLNNVLYITIPGVTITYKRINYPIVIEASGVTIEHCLIRPNAAGYGVPIVQAGNATIRDSEIDCSAIPLNQVGFSIAVAGENCIIERCNIHGASTGIGIHNSSPSRISVAQGNYIHDLRLYTNPNTGETAHVDGLTIRRSNGLGVIVRNNFIRVEPNQATGALFIQANSYINNVLVQGNLLQGYGNCLCLEQNTAGYGYNMFANNNRLDAWTVQGAGPWYAAVAGGPGWNEWTNNYAYDPNSNDCQGIVIPEPQP